MPQMNTEGLMSILPMVGIVVLFILMMVIPQRKRKKQFQAMMDSLAPGKMIKTIGGIYAKVVAVKDDLITVELPPDKVRMVFAKGAVATVEDSDLPENEMTDKK